MVLPEVFLVWERGCLMCDAVAPSSPEVFSVAARGRVSEVAAKRRGRGTIGLVIKV